MNKTVKPLSLRQGWIYAIGQLGWATMINVIGLQLVYFYIPTVDSGIPVFISQATFLLVLNAVAILGAIGRVFDAFTDPIIAYFSDKYDHPNGRRIPFMRWGILPAGISFFLLFYPIVDGASWINIAWFLVIQFIFYASLTVYVTPYLTLISEFGHTPKERLNLATYISVTYAIGIAIAAQVPGIATAILESGFCSTIVESIQTAIMAIAIFSMICMLIPTLSLKEKLHSIGKKSEVAFMTSLKSTFKNKHFKYYIIADLSYFLGMTLVMTGLLYYITVLLELGEEKSGLLTTVMIIISFLVYPIVNKLAKIVGKKKLICFAFVLMAINFISIYFLGKMPFANMTQAWILIAMMAVPMAFLGILPNAVLADIALHSSKTTGVNQEGMYFAARTLMQKFGQTIGIFLFAVLTTFGKDIGDDLGIRLSGIVGAAFCIFAAVYFLFYNEKEVLSIDE